MHENKRDLRTRLPGKTQYAKQCFLAMRTELKSNENTRQNTYKLLFSSAVRLRFPSDWNLSSDFGMQCKVHFAGHLRSTGRDLVATVRKCGTKSSIVADNK